MIRNTTSVLEENHHGKIATSQNVDTDKAIGNFGTIDALNERNSIPHIIEPANIRTTSIAPEHSNRGTAMYPGQDKNSKDNTSTNTICLLYTSPSPRDRQKSRMPSSA